MRRRGPALRAGPPVTAWVTVAPLKALGDSARPKAEFRTPAASTVRRPYAADRDTPLLSTDR